MILDRAEQEKDEQNNNQIREYQVSFLHLEGRHMPFPRKKCGVMLLF